MFKGRRGISFFGCFVTSDTQTDKQVPLAEHMHRKLEQQTQIMKEKNMQH
jgi:hypothetical protein